MNLSLLSDPDSFGFCLPTIDVFLLSELHSYERLIWLLYYFSFSFIKSFYILEHSSWVFSHIISALRKILIVMSCKCLQFLARWTKISTKENNPYHFSPTSFMCTYHRIVPLFEIFCHILAQLLVVCKICLKEYLAQWFGCRKDNLGQNIIQPNDMWF